MHKNQKGFHHIILVLFIVVIGIIGAVGYQVYKKNQPKDQDASVAAPKLETKNGVTYDTRASESLTRKNCSGQGSTTIGAPMKLEQVGFIQPYGLMVGGHVTPVDHQYYNGLDVSSPRDTYDVIAPADGYIVDISHRGNNVNTPLHSKNNPSSDEYRIVIAHSCSFLTYVDLVTSLDDSIKSQMPKDWNISNNQPTYVKIPIKKGAVVGRIGGQTLDFAVWNLEKPLKGFSNRTAYDIAEPWKPYTAPTTDYLDKSIKDKVIAKYVRTVQPIDGKIDYDQNGKLIGTWFLEGSNGYQGGLGEHRNNYYVGHLSIAPDYIDPSTFVVSTGSYPVSRNGGSNEPGNPTQFWVKGNAPKPETVTPTTGKVKYELIANDHYNKSDGTQWTNSSFASNLKAAPGTNVEGVLLVEMLEKGKIKVEFFHGKTAGQVNDFTGNAKIYDRGDGAKVGPPTSTAS